MIHELRGAALLEVVGGGPKMGMRVERGPKVDMEVERGP